MSQEKNTLQNGDVKLSGNMGMAALILFGIAAMSPNVIYLYAGIMPQMTGGHYALTILITGTVMFFSALSYSRMTRIYQKSGSVYAFTSNTMGPKVGFMAGWAIIADYLLLPMTCYLSFGLYLNAFIPGIPVWAWVLMGMAAVVILSIKGVQIVSSVNSFFTAVGIIFLIFSFGFIVAYVIRGGGAGTFFDFEAIYNPQTFVFDGVLTAAGVLCCGFVGFDAISTMSEEAKNAEKNIPRAIILCCVLAAGIFFIMAYIMQLAWPTSYKDIVDPNTGILEMFEHVEAGWLIPIFSVLKAFTSLMCCLAGTNAVGRVLYNMGKDNFLPKKVFGYLHPKFKTPVFNIILATIVGMGSLFFSDNLAGAASLVSFGALTGFSFTNLSTFIQYYIIMKENRGGLGIIRYGLLPLIGLAACIYLIVNLAMQAKIVGICWLGFGLIYLAIKTKGFRENPAELNLE